LLANNLQFTGGISQIRLISKIAAELLNLFLDALLLDLERLVLVVRLQLLYLLLTLMRSPEFDLFLNEVEQELLVAHLVLMLLQLQLCKRLLCAILQLVHNLDLEWVEHGPIGRLPVEQLSRHLVHVHALRLM